MRRLASLCLVAAGCAAPGSLGDDPNLSAGAGASASSCEVWTGDFISSRRVAVKGDWAVSRTLLGDRRIARIEQGGAIVVDGLILSSRKGSFSNGRLTLKGLISDTESDPIEGGEVRFPGILVASVYRYSPGCSSRAAALGAMALHILEEEESSKGGR